jgi:hypothetical protein
MLYSIMVGSFLSIFVPECVPRRIAQHAQG